MSEADLLIRAARAVDAMQTAADYAHAADDGVDLPGHAARAAWDAGAVLRDVGERFIDLSEQQAFAARRFEKAQQEENRTGHEYKGPSAA